MTDAPIPQPPADTPSAPAAVCQYCQTALDPALYFCRACATPYKGLHTLVGRTRPVPLTFRQRVERRAPAAWPLFWTYFTVLVVGSFVLRFALSATPQVSMFVMDAALAIVTLYFSIVYFATLRPQLGRFGFDHRAAWIGLGLLPVALGVNFLWSSFLQEIASRPVVDIVQELRNDGLSEMALFLAIAVFPAICEEIAYRGLLQTWLHAALGLRKALVVTSALFTAMHFSILSAPYLFALGWFLGWVRVKTGSLYPSILIHFLHNWCVLNWFGS